MIGMTEMIRVVPAVIGAAGMILFLVPFVFKRVRKIREELRTDDFFIYEYGKESRDGK